MNTCIYYGAAMFNIKNEDTTKKSGKILWPMRRRRRPAANQRDRCAHMWRTGGGSCRAREATYFLRASRRKASTQLRDLLEIRAQPAGPRPVNERRKRDVGTEMVKLGASGVGEKFLGHLILFLGSGVGDIPN